MPRTRLVPRTPTARASRGAGAAAAALTPARLSLGRATVGVSMLARPRLLTTALGVDSATAARTGWVVQMLGAREVGLGVGALLGIRSGSRAETRRWLAAGLLSDAVDALAVAGALGRGRVRSVPAVAVVAVATAAVAVQAAQLGRRP